MIAVDKMRTYICGDIVGCISRQHMYCPGNDTYIRTTKLFLVKGKVQVLPEPKGKKTALQI
jgi:hypothetical protein